MILSKQDEEKRVRNKELASRRSELWVREANGRLSEISKILFTISALIFTLSSTLFLNSSNLDCANKILLLCSWIFNLLSLGFGLWSLKIDANYFNELKRIENASEGIWSQNKPYRDMVDEDRINRKSYKEKSTSIPLSLQVFTAVCAFLLLFVLGINTLFNVYSYSYRDIQSNQKFVWQKSDCTCEGRCGLRINLVPHSVK